MHETANLSDSDEPVCTTGLREEAFPKFGPKYEIQARVNIGIDARLFVNGTIAISKRIVGERRFESETKYSTMKKNLI